MRCELHNTGGAFSLPPMLTEPGKEITWGEFSIFAAAGFTEVNRPTQRRVVMRIDF